MLKVFEILRWRRLSDEVGGFQTLLRANVHSTYTTRAVLILRGSEYRLGMIRSGARCFERQWHNEVTERLAST